MAPVGCVKGKRPDAAGPVAKRNLRRWLSWSAAGITKLKPDCGPVTMGEMLVTAAAVGLLLVVFHWNAFDPVAGAIGLSPVVLAIGGEIFERGNGG